MCLAEVTGRHLPLCLACTVHIFQTYIEFSIIFLLQQRKDLPFTAFFFIHIPLLYLYSSVQLIFGCYATAHPFTDRLGLLAVS